MIDHIIEEDDDDETTRSQSCPKMANLPKMATNKKNRVTRGDNRVFWDFIQETSFDEFRHDNVEFGHKTIWKVG